MQTARAEIHRVAPYRAHKDSADGWESNVGRSGTEQRPT